MDPRIKRTITLTEYKDVVDENGRKKRMKHIITTDIVWDIEEMLEDDYPDFLAAALGLIALGAVEEAEQRIDDVLAKGSSPNKELMIRRAFRLVKTIESLAQSEEEENEVGESLSDYLNGYLTYRNRMIWASDQE
jgi:hypothetical protein